MQTRLTQSGFVAILTLAAIGSGCPLRSGKSSSNSGGSGTSAQAPSEAPPPPPAAAPAPTNQAPVIHSFLPTSTSLAATDIATNPIEFSVQATDPEGTALRYLWSIAISSRETQLNEASPTFGLFLEFLRTNKLNDAETITVLCRVLDAGGAFKIQRWTVRYTRRAVYVSANRGVDQNAGTREAPVRTLSWGFSLASRNGFAQVRVDRGTYAEPVLILPNGMDVEGSFNGDDHWSRRIGIDVSTIQVSSNGILARDLSVPSEIRGFDIQAADATTVAESSYGLRIIRSRGFRVAQNLIRPGRGMPGAQGAAGAAGRDGVPGYPGASGVQGNGGPGGLGAYGYCSNSGGYGGFGGTLASSGNAGQSIGSSFGGRGGAGSNLAAEPGQPAQDGQPGQNGAFGLSGQPSNPRGQIQAEFWKPTFGTDGQAGLAGAGGSGGGGGGGQLAYFSDPSGGGGGGGGGSGGCPGAAGRAAQGGGASVGVLVVQSFETALEENTIFQNEAGAGGTGGSGGPGGVGGLGAPGGAAASVLAGTGGRGGSGGSGGVGGGGGSGAGGPSAAVLFAGQTPVLISNQIQRGGVAPAPGGAGRVPAGAGLVTDVLEVDP